MQILIPFIDDDKSLEFTKYGGFHMGVDVDIINIFALASGVITEIRRDANGFDIMVKYDELVTLRYMRIRQTSLRTGSVVSKGDAIGVANKYLHFEYLRPIKPQMAQTPVRIGRTTFFRYDSEPILQGELVIDNSDIWYANLLMDPPDIESFTEVFISPEIGMICELSNNGD
jgi:murein DD-endopeptidase MepM/ murein hydrolase activator NlpD